MGKKKKEKIQKVKTEVPNRKRSFRWVVVFLFALACGLYLNTLRHEFAFDDSVVITGNKFTKQGIDGIPELVSKDLFAGIYGTALDLEGGRWRPLTLAMFAVEYEWFGENATPYHFINVFLYGICAVVLFITLLQMLSGFKWGEMLAFLTALLFAAHPIHTEVVANIKSRDEILSFLFFCLLLLFLFRFVKTQKRKFIFFALLFYFTALLSKENGITFIAVIPLALFCFSGKNLKQSLALTIPFLLVALVYLAIRTSLVGMIGDRQTDDLTDNPFLQNNFPALPTEIPFPKKFATVFWILLKYIILLVFPHPLVCDYGYNQIPAISFSSPKAIASVCIHLVLLFFSLKVLLNKIKTRRHSVVPFPKPENLIFSFAFLFHMSTISVVSNLFFLIGTSMGERFVFTTSLGFCLALAAAILRWTPLQYLTLNGRLLKNPTFLVWIFPVLLVYSFKTISRNPVWKKNETLFAEDVKTNPNSSQLHYYFANTMFTSHMEDPPSPKRDSLFREAKKEFLRALQINPYFHYCYYNLGLIAEKSGQADSAIFWHNKVIHLKPENTMAQYMAKGALGLVYGKLKGDADKAMPLLKEALLYKPDDPGYHENLGICYAMKGDYDSSIRQFETAMKLKPEIKKEDARIFLNLALSYQNKGDQQKSDYYFNKAFKLDPSLKK